MFEAPLIREYLILLVGALPLMLLVGKLFFGSWQGFVEALRFLVMPDIISMFRGEWAEDWWATLKIWVFVLMCGAGLYSAHQHFFPG